MSYLSYVSMLYHLFLVVDVLNKTDQLSDWLSQTSTSQRFSGGVGNKLRMVAKLIKLNTLRNVNRDVFFLTQASQSSTLCFDYHPFLCINHITDTSFVYLTDCLPSMIPIYTYSGRA